MAPFSEERAPSRPFGRWDLAVMVGTKGICEKAVRGVGRKEGPELYWSRAPVQKDPFGEEA